MTTIFPRLALPNQSLLFDLEQLYRCLQTVPDRRKRRGRRYPVAALLIIGVLAKLAGQVSLRAISLWAQLRHHDLSELSPLRLPKGESLCSRTTLQQLGDGFC